MAVEVFIAKMTDFMDEATIISWLADDGSQVDEGQPILEVETDKTNAELDAPATGYLRIRPGVDPGAKVPVGDTIGWIVDTADEPVVWP